MRLIDTLDTETPKLCDVGKEELDYAVLSHQWEPGEYQYQDLVSQKLTSRKIQAFRQESRKKGCTHCWADTCCINKSSISENNEAIASMYSWFKNAKLCCVYLKDVKHSENNFAKASWFTRSWALLEMLAPKPESMFFFDCDWMLLGSKEELSATISKVTGVPTDVLLHERDPMSATIGEKLSWASTRDALKKEEVIYALISLLGLRMDMRPGEGQAMATMRMKEHILGNLEDYTVLMWKKPMGLARGHRAEIEDPERTMEQPTWSQMKLHSPIDLISTEGLKEYVPGLDKLPTSPELTGRGLRVTLLAKSIRSFMIVSNIRVRTVVRYLLTLYINL